MEEKMTILGHCKLPCLCHHSDAHMWNVSARLEKKSALQFRRTFTDRLYELGKLTSVFLSTRATRQMTCFGRRIAAMPFARDGKQKAGHRRHLKVSDSHARTTGL